MFERVEIRDDEFEEVVKRARANMIIRLANTNHNWTSTLDREIARIVPELKKQDEDTEKPEIGTYNVVSKTIRNGLLLGHRIIDFLNIYCLAKDSSGRFSLDENSFKKVVKELELKYKEKLWVFLVRNEGPVNKMLVASLLRENIHSNKVQILG